MTSSVLEYSRSQQTQLVIELLYVQLCMGRQLTRLRCSNAFSCFIRHWEGHPCIRMSSAWVCGEKSWIQGRRMEIMPACRGSPQWWVSPPLMAHVVRTLQKILSASDGSCSTHSTEDFVNVDCKLSLTMDTWSSIYMPVAIVCVRPSWHGFSGIMLYHIYKDTTLIAKK